MKRAADLLVTHAQSGAETARSDVLATLHELRGRLDPRVIAAEAAENAVGRVNYLLAEASTGVKSRPLLTLGGAAAFALAVGLRIWLIRAKKQSDAT